MSHRQGLGALLVLLVLQGAGCKDDPEEKDLIVSVRNDGSSPADIAIHLRAKHEWDEFHEVRPGETWSGTYPTAYQVNLEVRRSSDGFVLFSDSLKYGDFEDVDWLWAIVVHP